MNHVQAGILVGGMLDFKVSLSNALTGLKVANGPKTKLATKKNPHILCLMPPYRTLKYDRVKKSEFFLFLTTH